MGKLTSILVENSLATRKIGSHEYAVLAALHLFYPKESRALIEAYNNSSKKRKFTKLIKHITNSFNAQSIGVEWEEIFTKDREPLQRITYRRYFEWIKSHGFILLQNFYISEIYLPIRNKIYRAGLDLEIDKTLGRKLKEKNGIPLELCCKEEKGRIILPKQPKSHPENDYASKRDIRIVQGHYASLGDSDSKALGWIHNKKNFDEFLKSYKLERKLKKFLG